MSTDGRERMESIWSQIQNWMENTNWTDADAADRVTQAVRDGGVDKFIDPLPGVPFPEAASGNYAEIKQEFGLETERERDTARRDFEDRQKAAAADEVEDQFREYGIQAVADAFEERAPPELQERFDDVFAEFGPDFYREIAFNEIGQVVEQFDIDAELVSRSRLEALQEQTGRRESTAQQMRQAEREVLTRLERAFGQRFDDVDDAITSLRNRIDQLQNLDVRSGDVFLRGRREGPPGIVTEIGFGAFEDAAKEQASKAIDASQVDVRRTYDKRIGSVRVAGDELQLIDLTPALELPAVADAIVDPDALVRRFEIEADVAVPPAPEVTDPDPSERDPEPRDTDDTVTPDDIVPDAEEEAATDDEPPEQPDTPGDGAAAEDETPTPDVGETPDLSADLRASLGAAVDAAPNGVAAIGRALNTPDLFELAAAIERGEIGTDDTEPILNAFQRASADERAQAASKHDGLGALQRELLGVAPREVSDPGDVEIEFEGDAKSVDDLIDEAEPDPDPQQRRGGDGRSGASVDPDEFIEDLADMFRGTGDVQSQPGSDRPDPNQAEADKRVAKLLGDRLMKGQAWVAAEQERLSRGFDDPGRFWDQFGQRIWGNTLSRSDFVNLSVEMQ